MNAGVSMIPCVVIKRPRRAFDSRSCEPSSNVFCIRGEIPRNRTTKQIQTSKYSLRPAILPLYSWLPASGARVEFFARPEAGFFVALSNDLGGALLLGFEKCPRSTS